MSVDVPDAWPELASVPTRRGVTDSVDQSASNMVGTAA